MKKARMNISHSRFILSKLKIFGEIVTTYQKIKNLFKFLQYRLNQKCRGLVLSGEWWPYPTLDANIFFLQMQNTQVAICSQYIIPYQS